MSFRRVVMGTVMPKILCLPEFLCRTYFVHDSYPVWHAKQTVVSICFFDFYLHIMYEQCFCFETGAQMHFVVVTF